MLAARQKFVFGAKFRHIWAMPAQIWGVPMSNVRMSNTDAGSAVASIKAAGSKDAHLTCHI